MNIKDAISLIRGANPEVTNGKLRAGLLALGVDAAAIDAEIPKGSRSGWTQTDTLEWLAETPRTEGELFELILDKEQQNEARWVRDRNKVRVLLNAIVAKYDPDAIPEETKCENLRDSVKALGKKTAKKA